MPILTPARILCGVMAFAALDGCAPRSYPNMTEFTITPSPTATPLYETYPIQDALSPSGPHLSAAQRRWILHVRDLKKMRKHRADLRFAFVEGARTPVIIYLRQADQDGLDRGGHVIGGGCNEYFDPYMYGVMVGTMCDPDS